MGKYNSYIIQKILFIKAPLLIFPVEYSYNLLCCTKDVNEFYKNITGLHKGTKLKGLAYAELNSPKIKSVLLKCLPRPRLGVLHVPPVISGLENTRDLIQINLINS